MSAELVQGGIAQLDAGATYVVANIEPNGVTLVVNRQRVLVDVARMTGVPMPRNGVSCLVCGKWWLQRGNRTGHCMKCHETFEGLTLFDAHQRVLASGHVDCLRASTITWRGERLRSVEGTWRGPQMDTTAFKKPEEVSA